MSEALITLNDIKSLCQRHPSFYAVIYPSGTYEYNVTDKKDAPNFDKDKAFDKVYRFLRSMEDYLERTYNKDWSQITYSFDFRIIVDDLLVSDVEINRGKNWSEKVSLSEAKCLEILSDE
jgi:hypothetical protein